MSVARLVFKRKGHAGWQARIRRPRGSRPADFTKFFSDSAWGGSRKAKAAAEQWERQERRRRGLRIPPLSPAEAGSLGGKARARAARRKR